MALSPSPPPRAGPWAAFLVPRSVTSATSVPPSRPPPRAPSPHGSCQPGAGGGGSKTSPIVPEAPQVREVHSASPAPGPHRAPAPQVPPAPTSAPAPPWATSGLGTRSAPPGPAPVRSRAFARPSLPPWPAVLGSPTLPPVAVPPPRGASCRGLCGWVHGLAPPGCVLSCPAPPELGPEATPTQPTRCCRGSDPCPWSSCTQSRLRGTPPRFYIVLGLRSPHL